MPPIFDTKYQREIYFSKTARCELVFFMIAKIVFFHYTPIKNDWFIFVHFGFDFLRKNHIKNIVTKKFNKSGNKKSCRF